MGTILTILALIVLVIAISYLAGLRKGWIVVYQAADPLLASEVKTALEGAGISVVELVDRSVAWTFSMPYGRYSRLLVPEPQAERAREIVADLLAAAERGELEAREESQADSSGEGEPS